MNDGLGVRIGKDDGAVVVDVGIDLRLDVEGDGGDGEREFAVHDPGGEVDAVAAEVEERAASVLFGVGEPAQKLGTYADLFGALMAVVDDELAEVADLAGGKNVGGFGVRGVPGGLVVREDGNVVLLRDGLDGESVFDGGGEGFFYHRGDVEGRGLLDGGTVASGGSVDEDGLRMRALEHRGFCGKEEIGG